MFVNIFMDIWKYYWSLANEKQRCQYILDAIFTSCGCYKGPSQVHSSNNTQLCFGGVFLCWTTTLLSLGCSKNKIQRCINLWKNYAHVPLHGNASFAFRSKRYFEYKAWLLAMFTTIGEKSPNSNIIHVPIFLDCRLLFKDMVLSLGKEQSLSYSFFLGLLKHDFSHV